MHDNEPAAVIPLVEERISANKRLVETGRVRVRTVVDKREVVVREELIRGSVDVVRVPVDRQVEAVPAVREEGGTIVVPVVEERIVVEKRLILVEEVHIRRSSAVEAVEQPVTLRSQRPVVERAAGRGPIPSSTLES